MTDKKTNEEAGTDHAPTERKGHVPHHSHPHLNTGTAAHGVDGGGTARELPVADNPVTGEEGAAEEQGVPSERRGGHSGQPHLAPHPAVGHAVGKGHTRPAPGHAPTARENEESDVEQPEDGSEGPFTGRKSSMKSGGSGKC
jgi:hypothetical protein